MAQDLASSIRYIGQSPMRQSEIKDSYQRREQSDIAFSLEQRSAEMKQQELIDQKTNVWLAGYEKKGTDIDAVKKQYDEIAKANPNSTELISLSKKMDLMKEDRGDYMWNTLQSAFAAYITKSSWANQEKLEGFIEQAKDDLTGDKREQLMEYLDVMAEIAGEMAPKLESTYDKNYNATKGKVDAYAEAGRGPTGQALKPEPLDIGDEFEVYAASLDPDSRRTFQEQADSGIEQEVVERSQYKADKFFADIAAKKDLTAPQLDKKLTELLADSDFSSLNPLRTVIVDMQNKLQDSYDGKIGWNQNKNAVKAFKETLHTRFNIPRPAQLNAPGVD